MEEWKLFILTFGVGLTTSYTFLTVTKKWVLAQTVSASTLEQTIGANIPHNLEKVLTENPFPALFYTRLVNQQQQGHTTYH